MNVVELFSLNEKKITLCDIDECTRKIYYQELRLPTENELKKHKSKYTVNDIKLIISKSDKYIPLFDVQTTNIYMIININVYARTIKGYRFPDAIIIDAIQKKMEKWELSLAKNSKLSDDGFFLRRIQKAKLMLKFMQNFDMDELYKTYLSVLYKYSPELSNATFTCIRKSYLPSHTALTPYYTKDEIIKLGLNQEIIKIPNDMRYDDYKYSLSDNDLAHLCKIVSQNDISSAVLKQHKKYIVDNNCASLIQYYTAQGSYFMNKYLRISAITETNSIDKTSPYAYYKNKHMEQNIRTIWNLILGAPAFDNDYILYRFVENDDYLNDIEIGDIFADNGFTSTTRDPFYKTGSYKFGFVLIKIRIPKGIKGIGLSLELLSHFPAEEEIILPPLTKLKLIAKNDKCDYYHVDSSFISQIVKRYEFSFVETSPIQFKPKMITTSNIINFNELKKQRKSYRNDYNIIESFGLRNNIIEFCKQYTDLSGGFYSTINSTNSNITCYIIVEKYNSSSVYSSLYGVNTSDGYCMYSIHDNELLFMIEFDELNDVPNIRINYMNKFSYKRTNPIINETGFIEFIASLAYYFDIYTALIYTEYTGCGTNAKQNDVTLIEGIYNTEGRYCVDFYEYFTSKWMRYNDGNILNVEILPKFSYEILDELRVTQPNKILAKNDEDELYQIHKESFLREISNDNENNIANFYVWLVSKSCGLIDKFTEKIARLLPRIDNPFIDENAIYVLDVSAFLYNRNIIKVYNDKLVRKINIIHNIPTNLYRLSR